MNGVATPYAAPVANLLSFPVRLGDGGGFAARDDADEAYYAEELAQLVQTEPGERELVPGYGLNDPTFGALDAAMLTAQVTLYGPPVAIVMVTQRPVGSNRTDVSVSFKPRADLAVGDDTASGEPAAGTESQ